MAEIWGAAIAVGGAVLSAKAAEKKSRQDSADARAMTKDSAKYEGILSQFNKEQDYYYEQLARKNKARGLEQFRQFSTVGSFAPNYKATDTTPVLPNKPDIDKMLNPETQGSGGGGGGGKITDKIAKMDPLTGAINKALGIKF